MIPFTHPLSKLAVQPSHYKTMLLANGKQSCAVASCPPGAALSCCVSIMRAGRGFVLPLRTPTAADGTAGIFSCYPCWRADRRSHRGSDRSQTAGSLCFFSLLQTFIVPIKRIVGSCCGALLISFFIGQLWWDGYVNEQLLLDFMSRHGNCSWMSISCWQALRAPDLWDNVVQIRPQGGWVTLMAINIMRWRHVLVWGWNPRLTTVPRTVWGWVVWCGCAWPLHEPVWLFWGAAPERRRGSELEQGIGIKSALILNYSRDKNSCPKRSVGDYGSPSSLVQTF